MPLPLTSLFTAEVIHSGTVASAGSNARRFDFVWHFVRAAITNSPSESALATAFIANIVTPTMAALNVRATTERVSVRFMEDPTRRAVFTSDTTPGAITGDSLPMTDAAYLLVNTPLRGRSYRGSKHFYPMSESDSTTTSDLWNAGTLTRLGAIATAAITPITDSTGNIWNLAVYARKLSNPTKQPAATIIATVASSVTVRKSIGDMKQRKITSVY